MEGTAPPRRGFPDGHDPGPRASAVQASDPDATRASDPDATRASRAHETRASHGHVSSLPDPLLRFGDFELLDEIGRGGMGVVYRARQLSLGRLVAVKMLLPGVAGPEHIRRFRTEASTAAALQHPNIVAVHEVGAWQGRQYLVMDFVAGRSLARHISDAAEGPVDFQQVARWCAAIADAVQHAHDLGILHRDIKPSNVLIDERNQPRVTDFGLAKRLGEDTELTLSGQALGSPSFMPPEQAEGGKVSRRSDVYGIGATLYHALTGRPPFRGESTTDVLNQVLTTDPVPPRALNATIPRDLETICLKCLEKDPSRRYESAARVADDLRRYLEGEPITARPVGTLERLWRRARKKPLAAAVVVSLGIAALLGWQAYDKSRQLQREARNHAVDVALDKASGGDREAAARALAEAERVGVEPAIMHLLRGQVALNTMRSKEAVKEFQAALAAAPQSVAARAALASALINAGDYDGFAACMEELADATPVTDEDYLFLGYATASLMGVDPGTRQLNPRSALALLQEAVRRRPTGTAFAMLGIAGAFHALDTGSWPAARTAMEHVNTASQLLGSAHPVVRCGEMNASTIALRLCPEAECPAVRERAAAVAAAIASRQGNPCGFIRALYCQVIGDREGEAQTMQRSAVRAAGMYAGEAAAVMLGFDRSAETLGLMRPVEDAADGFAVVGRMYLLLDAGRRDEAERLYASVADRQVASRPFAEGVLLLAGESDRVAVNARRIVASLPAKHPLRPVFQFWAGDLSEQAFLDRSGPSRLAQCALRYFAGMAALGRGERERAAAHFRAAVETGAHWRQEYQWSRAFLMRMDQDPTWPGRLQGKSTPGAPSE